MAEQITGVQGTVARVREFIGDLLEGAVEGDYSEKQTTGKFVGQIGGGLIPGYGQIADARDTVAALEKTIDGKEGGARDLVLALVGWVPLLGDAVKGSVRSGKAVLKQVDNLPGGATADILRKQFDEAGDTVQGQMKGLSYEPTVTADPTLPPGYGFTNKYGDVTYSSAGSKTDQALVYHHEMVHSFLSPKLDVLREFRADVKMTGYEKSSFLRYFEEALAESYAQVKVNGLSTDSLLEGLSFPIKNGYVELKDVVKEGAIGTVLIGGALYGVHLAVSDE